MQSIAQIIARTKTSRSEFGPRPLIATTPGLLCEALYDSYKANVEARGMVCDDAGALPAIEQAARWMTEAGKPWLFLSGNVGTGKTTLMRSMLDMLLQYDIPAKMFRASEFPALFLNNIEQTERQILRGEWCTVLMLDDVGVDQTEYKEYGNVLRPFVKVIEERYDRQLPLVVSTNLSGAEIRAAYGERTIDRIKEMAVGIVYNGKSYRK